MPIQPRDLTFQNFRPEDYPVYAPWFADPELNTRLGPMGEDWLEAVLQEQAEGKGETWAAFLGEELVGVVNEASRRLVESCGFQLARGPDEHGYVEYRRCPNEPPKGADLK